MASIKTGKGAAPAAALAMIWLAAGCSSPVWLAVDTSPSGSRVTIRDAETTAVREKAAPFDLELVPAGDAAVYTITAEPPDAEADRWEAASVKLSARELRALPPAPGAGQGDVPASARHLTVKLEKKPLAMLVTTRPGAAAVAVKNTLGQPLASGPAPLSLSFYPVQESEQLTIEVRPEATGDVARYETRTMQMTVADIRRLPAMSGDMGRRRLDVDLAELNVVLTLEARPGTATLAVRDSAGQVLGSGPSPLTVTLSPRAGTDVLTFTAEPTGPAANQYQPASKDLTFEYLRTLPAMAGGRRVMIELREAPYTVTPQVVTYDDSEGRRRAAVLGVRAYRDIAETGSAVPARITDMGKALLTERLALSPDGQRVAFALMELGDADQAKPDPAPVTLGALDIPVKRAMLQAVRTEPGGGVQHITTDNFRDSSPAFTRDGKWLLFASDRRRPDGQDILRVSAESNRGGIADIYVDQRGAVVSSPSHATNGTVAFMMDTRDTTRPGNRFQVWTVGGPGQFPSQITLGTDPVISPDGSRIAYVGPDGNLWVVGADGVGATQLTFNAARIIEAYRKSLTEAERDQLDLLARATGGGVEPVRAYASPTWSADSQLILFSAMEGRDPTGRSNHDIWCIRPDGTGKQQLTANGSADLCPLIAPDHKTIYFLSNRGGYWAIWRIAAPQISG